MLTPREPLISAPPAERNSKKTFATIFIMLGVLCVVAVVSFRKGAGANMETLVGGQPDLSKMDAIGRVKNVYSTSQMGKQKPILPCATALGQDPKTATCYGDMTIEDFNKAFSDATEAAKLCTEGNQNLYIILQTGHVRYFDDTAWQKQKEEQNLTKAKIGHTSMLSNKGTPSDLANAADVGTSPVVYAGTFTRTGNDVKFDNDSGHFMPNKTKVPDVAKLLGVDEGNFNSKFASEMTAAF